MPPSLGSEALPLFPRIVSEDGFMSMDSLLLQSGGHGRCQWLTTLFGVYLWAVHGAQVMSFVFIGKDVEGEFVGDSSLLRLTGTFFFIGWMCGLNLWGWLAARRGWLVALASMEALVVVGGLLTAMCTDARPYLLCRVLVGFAEGGVPTCAYGYSSEFLLPADKTRCITALQLGFIGGSMLLALAASASVSAAGTATAVHTGSLTAHTASAMFSWRELTIGASLFALPVLLIARSMPESPRWLMRSGRVEECARVLRSISEMNGHGTLDITANELLAASGKVSGHRGTAAASAASSASGSIAGLLCAGGPVTRVTLTVALHAFAYTSAFFGLSVAIANDSASGPHDDLITLALQVPSVFVTGWMLERLGRRLALLVMLGGLGASCWGVAAFAPAAGAPLHRSLAMVGCVISSSMFSAGYVASAEMFPTEVRSVGLSAMSQAARLGGAMAPLILLLADTNASLPFAVWGGIAVVASLAALLLPETNGKASLETLQDLSTLVELPSPTRTLGSTWRASFRELDKGRPPKAGL